MASEKTNLPEPEYNPPPYSAGPPPPAQVPQVVHAVQVPMSSVTYVTTGPSVVVPVRTVNIMGSKPSSYTCKSCHAEIVTRTENKVTTRTHIFALVMCLFGLWCCACIPYCMDSCKNVDHYCPNCNAYIGSNKP